MFTPLPRLFILTALSGAAILLAMAGKIPLLILASLLSLFVLWDYVNRSTVPLAMSRMAVGKYEEAYNLLRYVKNPKRLNRANRAYYHLIKGMYYRENNEFKNALEELENAQNIGIKNNNYNAMNHLALADISIINKNKEKARSLLIGIKNLKVDKSIAESISKMNAYLSQN